METLNGIEEAEWHAEGTSNDLGCLHLHWLGEAFWVSPGKGKSGEENGRVNVLAHCSLWEHSPFALQEAVLLNVLEYPAAGQGAEGIPCRGRLGCGCLQEDEADKIWSQGSACGHRWLVGRGQKHSSLYFTLSAPHHSCTTSSLLSPLLS